jgi:hypothetical protein
MSNDIVDDSDFFNELLDGMSNKMSNEVMLYNLNDVNRIYDLTCIKFPGPLECLIFTYAINYKSMSKIKWPVNLFKLTFGNRFNDYIISVKWPPSLNTLIFGQDFNRQLNYVIFPRSLHTLKLGGNFNQDVSKFKCPEMLYDISIIVPLRGIIWSNAIDTMYINIIYTILHFPESLNELHVERMYDVDARDIKWPQMLQKLYITRLTNIWNHAILPQSLRLIHVIDVLDNIYIIWPKTLHTLTFENVNNYNIISLTISTIPSSLSQISTSSTSLLFPETLYRISFGIKFNQNINRCWSNSLGIMTLGRDFNHVLSNSLKFPSLSIIKFGKKFNQDINIVWPVSLREITFGYKFKQDIKNVIFIELYIVHDYSCTITITSCNFPKSLQKIIYYDDYGYLIHYERKIGQHTKMANRMNY